MTGKCQREWKPVVFIIACVFLLSGIGIGGDDRAGDHDKLKTELMAVFQSKGENGIRDFAKERIIGIDNKFIVEFAENGVKERKKEALDVCLILAEEKKDEKTLADVCYKIGEYHQLTSDNKMALDYFEKAFPVYVKLNDRIGQGNVYKAKGDIFLTSGEKPKAEGMLNKALTLFDEADYLVGQGNVYLGKGNIYLLTSNNPKALEMYDKALLFFEQAKYLPGQANAYRCKGEICFYEGKYPEAFVMYDKALPLFEKEGDTLGQGNVYFRKGLVHFYNGEIKKSLELLDKAAIFFERARSPVGQAGIYLYKGEIYTRSGEYQQSQEMYDKALTFFENAGHVLGQANSYLKKGHLYLWDHKNNEAIKMYDKALSLYEKIDEPVGQGNVYINKGDIYSYMGNNSLALDMYNKALVFFEKARDPIGQGNVYVSMGMIYADTGEKSRALEMYDKALLFFESLNEPMGMGNVYREKGDVYAFSGEKSKALEMYEKALPCYEKAGDFSGQGNVYHARGDIYLISGENSNALEMYNKALSCFTKVEDVSGQGNVYRSMGDIYLRVGNNFRALEMYNKAQEFFEKSPAPLSMGNISRSKGNLYIRIGDNQKALEMYDRALSFYEKDGQLLGQSNIYLGKGDIYLANGESSRSLEMYDRALNICEKDSNPLGKGNVYWSKGNCYFYLDDYPKALEMYDKALPYYEIALSLAGKGNVYRNKGDVYLETKSYSKAIACYENAYEIFDKIGDMESLASVLHGKAKIFAEQGKKKKALDLFEQGVLLLEKVRTMTAFSEMKKAFLEKVYYQYQDTAVSSLENKYNEKGFKYVEMMKTRVFSDKLAEGLVPLEKGISQESRQKRDDLVSKLSIFSKQIDEAANKNDKEKLKELSEQYRKLQTDFDQLLAKIRIDNPFYAAVQYPEPITLQELRNVLEKDELMLRYFVSPDKLYVFIISKKEFKVIPIEIKEASVNQLVRNYLASIGINQGAEIRKYATRLANAVFNPLKDHLNSNKNIIIIPDGELAKVPFESYIIKRNDQGRPVYLVSEYRVKYVQSATVLALIRKLYKRKGITNHFIGFGDPVYDYENFKKGKPEVGTQTAEKGSITGQIHHKKYDKEDGKYVRLKGSGVEVKTIADFFKQQSQKTVIYERLEANETNARSTDLKYFDYIHFSCHGVMGDVFQCLVLSQVPDAPEDGYLTLNEIMNCDYNAKLVVLSACKTGKGEMTKGEGVTGLTQAVMYAGTPGVVASLWGVDEDATKDLMIEFYKNMLEKGMTKDKALREAKLAMIKSGKYASPYYWGAFVMYGE